MNAFHLAAIITELLIENNTVFIHMIGDTSLSSLSLQAKRSNLSQLKVGDTLMEPSLFLIPYTNLMECLMAANERRPQILS